jgi:hypothetical protein
MTTRSTLARAGWTSTLVLALAPCALAGDGHPPLPLVGAPDRPDDPRFGLLTPIPDRGAVPPIVEILATPSDEELAMRSAARRYERELTLLRRQHFGSMRAPEIRAAGIARLAEFTDPAAFRPMIEILGGEADDVRGAMLDHFAAQGDEGQGALAWIAIMDDRAARRDEALRRLTAPPPLPVLRVLDQALRSPKHRIADTAGFVAGSLGALETIPLLIFAQNTRDPAPQDEGALAWIAIETQHAYVANVVPVVGDNSGAFVPIVGVVSEGIVLTVQDAVVIVYRTQIHDALVNLTTWASGESTAHLGYDMKAWWSWYNDEFVPERNERARRAALAEQDEERGAGAPGGAAGGAPAGGG